MLATETRPGWLTRTVTTSREPVAICADTIRIVGFFAFGVIVFDGTDAADGPSAFVAVTVNVYAVPLARPVTVQESGPVVHEHDAPPGLAVTVYPMIGDPPVRAGARHETTLRAFAPSLANTLVGAPGGVRNAKTVALP
jgi:hypothetical protein